MSLIALLLTYRDGREKTFFEAVDDEEAYVNITDDIFRQILDWNSRANEHTTDLQQAKAILQNIKNRELYKFVGQTIIKGKKYKKVPVNLLSHPADSYT